MMNRQSALVISWLLLAGGAAGAAPRPDTATVARRLDAHADSLTRAGAFSGAVLLAEDGVPVFRKAYGLASRQPEVANRPDTKFNLGSINKVFTKLAIAQLAQSGKVRLDDTLDRYLPDYPREAASRITIAQLVDHSAGVGDVFGERYDRMDHSRLRHIADWIPLFRDVPLAFEPGSRSEYSNGGYVLLGAVIEKASGQDYYDYIREHVYGPAGMRNTDSYASNAGIANLASGYTRHSAGGTDEAEDGALHDNAATRPWRGSSAGGGYSTADDLLRFAQVLRESKLVSEAWTHWVIGGPAPGSLDKAPRPRDGGGGRAPGFSMAIGGGAPGINAAIEIDGRYTVIVLANLDPPAAQEVASTIRDWWGLGAGSGGGRKVMHAGHGAGPHATPKRTVVPPGGVEVPMLRAGHLPAVEVRVNGQGPFRFAIDTGGAGSARIDSALAARLGLRKVGVAMTGDPSGQNRRQVDLVAVDSIEMGGARFVGLVCGVRGAGEPRPGEAVEGILGFGLFGGGMLNLDYPTQHVRFTGGELPPANGNDILSYEDEDGIPTVTLQVDSLTVDAHLDAGSPGGFTLPGALAGKLRLASELRVIAHGRTVSNTFEIKGSSLVGELRLGGLVYPKADVAFTPIFPMGNVGERVLRELNVTFDPKHRRVKLARAGS